ncbi:VWA domain-containing protein [Dialister invisus]|jgi:magnesium chelatase subunit D|uniref:VWA domain-containing protein n=1 Tax=Dialister invisus TaxID=218538 RepID=UPI0003402FF8|nr:VWA domain-containing protein [Dialister invisus]MUU09039.1 VWA domain-containing protein [Dialister invisus]CCZ54330.1 magnesium-chelatase subunit D/I family [Dialister invisus CAG:218]
MMKRNNFPFSAVLGLNHAKTAILIVLVNPRAGGLLISGPRGIGKSTLMRSTQELIERPWRDIPVSVTEDRLFGTIDTEKAIYSGQKKLYPGIINEADQGVLYLDDANLLREDLLDSILNIAEVGAYQLERDGLSLRCDTSFTVIAAINPESGMLSGACLDQFGLFVNVDNIHDENTRVEILKRTISFEKDCASFCKLWKLENEKIKKAIHSAMSLLPKVVVSSAMIQLASVYALKAHVSGHRADIYLIEAARALAALAERRYVLPKDLEKAAEFVLPHRMRKNCEQELPQSDELENPDKNDIEKDQESENNNLGDDGEDPSGNHIVEAAGNGSDNDESSSDMPEFPQGADDEKVDPADSHVILPPLWIQNEKKRFSSKGSGKRNMTRSDERQGRYVKAGIPKGETHDIAIDATLRAAAPHQKGRRSNGCAVVIRHEDIRRKEREKRTGNIFLFLVDASGSMGARERMKAVKGVVFKMLADAYQKRDRVGMIAFRRDRAEVLLPITRSIEFAQKKLAALPTGGKTPLAQGLIKAEDMLDRLYKQDPLQDPVLILITDGRATNSLNKNTDPVRDALSEAERIGHRHMLAAVIDTESSFIKLGLAKELAQKMGASYFHVDKISEDRLLCIGRQTAYERGQYDS